MPGGIRSDCCFYNSTDYCRLPRPRRRRHQTSTGVKGSKRDRRTWGTDGWDGYPDPDTHHQAS